MDMSIVKKTQDLLGPFIQNPPLADKFLQKPPIRFLHDIFIAISNQHQLMKGLFDEDEIQWKDSIANHKDAKLFFISKVINFVCLASAETLNIEASRVCAGQEPEKTNLLLQNLAKILSSKSAQNPLIIQQVQEGLGPIDLKVFAKSTAFLKQRTTIAQPKLGAVESATIAQLPVKTLGEKERMSPKTLDKTNVRLKSDVESEKSKTNKSSTTKEVKEANKPLKAVPKKDVAPTTPNSKNTTSAAMTEKIKKSAMEDGIPAANVRPSSVRPTTGRAPQRPPTAGMRGRSDTYDLLIKNQEEEQDVPPSHLTFLEDAKKDGKEEIEELLMSTEEFDGARHIQILDSSLGLDEKDDVGQLVSNLRETRKVFAEQNAQVDQSEFSVNPFAQQEVAKFTAEVEDLRNSLQKVSRLSDVLSTFMELLPDDFEDMEKDRQRYSEEYQALQTQIEEASRAEQKELEKLGRKLTLNEETLFAINEEMASTQYRIKEKSDLLTRLQSLQ